MIETLRHIDTTLFHFINSSVANPFLDVVCAVLRGKPFLAIFYSAVGVRLFQLYPKQFLRIAIAGALTFLLTDQISSAVIKPFFHRIRPCNNPEIGARLVIDYCGSGFSFVSSHATNSFGLATFLVLVVKTEMRQTLLLILWASLVSFSQVYVGVHFPADVMAGALIGVFIATIISLVSKRYFFEQT